MNRLRRGHLKTGDRFPSVRQVARDFGVSSLTASLAINQLSTAGWVDVRPGIGSFVTVPPDAARRRALTIGVVEMEEHREHLGLYGGVSAPPHVPHLLSGLRDYFPADSATFSFFGYRKGELARPGRPLEVALTDRAVDGLIITGPITPVEADFLQERRVPFVLCHHTIPDRVASKVLLNWPGAFDALLRRLWAGGHRRLGMIHYRWEWPEDAGRQDWNPPAHLRRLGWGEVTAEDVVEIDNSDGLQPLAVYDAAVARVMERGPTAIVAFDELIASRVIRYCLQRRLSIPDDLSLAALNDLTPNAHPIRLTAADAVVGLREMAREAARLLDQAIRGGASQDTTSWIGLSVVEGESIGPVGMPQSSGAVDSLRGELADGCRGENNGN